MSEHAPDNICFKQVFYEKSRVYPDKKVLNSAISFRDDEGRYIRVIPEEIVPGYRRGTGDFPVESEENEDIPRFLPSDR
jgi:hypothetical protein